MQALKLAVVGHTNTGKTSLMRTLLRDIYFGEVKNAPATTRHVEKAVISDAGTPLVELFDTPGLEDATGLLDWLEDNTASRRDGIERLQQFLANPIAQTDFNQEAKVVKQLLDSDMAIYVVDAREPVLGKYKDELGILAWCAIPVMPVFNFCLAAEDNISAWQTMLARRTLHISTRFDSVAFEFNDEMQLWQNLAVMLDKDANKSQTLSYLTDKRTKDWQMLYDDATILISHFLLNIAAFVKEIDKDDDASPVLSEMQEKVRQAERQMQEKLLKLYQFYDNSIASTPLALNEYQQDPFDPDLLASYGIRTTSGAAAGALIGLGIDAATLGASLGLGAAIGGLAGGLLPNTGLIMEKLSGIKKLYIDPATITLLATRAIDLLQALRHRGHAATDDIMLNQGTAPWQPEKLPSLLKKARGKPYWSGLNGGDIEKAHTLRDEAAWQLSRALYRKHEL